MGSTAALFPSANAKSRNTPAYDRCPECGGRCWLHRHSVCRKCQRKIEHTSPRRYTHSAGEAAKMHGVPGRADAIQRYRVRAALDLPLFLPVEAIAAQLRISVETLALMLETKARQLAQEECHE